MPIDAGDLLVIFDQLYKVFLMSGTLVMDRCNKIYRITPRYTDFYQMETIVSGILKLIKIGVADSDSIYFIVCTLR